MRRVSTIVEILKSPEHSEGKPSEPPFAGGMAPPRSPLLLTQLAQVVYKKGSPR